MKSSLYRCSVTHHRSTPRIHHFTYGVFMLALDLDEIYEVARSVKIFSRNARNLCSFHDRDHLPGPSPDLRGNVERWLALQGMGEKPARIVLVTTPRVFGFVFNPVSFYLCFDQNDQPLCAIAEVSNTYREMKPYLLAAESFDGARFRRRVRKEFYVSPFLQLDDEFEFLIGAPEERLAIAVNTWRGTERIVAAVMHGARRPLTSRSLLAALVAFPLGGLRVLAAIHWEAFRLWLKRIPHHPKNERIEEQRDIVKGSSIA
jgi:DUF1365 family protein